MGVVTNAAVDAAQKVAEMKQALRGRTPEQQQVIKYFYGAGGCLSKGLSDDDYQQMVMKKASSTDFKAKALDKIGLDESQVNEIAPVHFEAYLFDKSAYALRRKTDHKWVSSKYQITWLFFSDSQVYVYQYTFNMDTDGKSERTEEYFYKDITNFSNSSDTLEKDVVDKVSCTGSASYIRTTVETDKFKMVVPGESFLCSMKKTDYTENAIKGMKNKLREKKGV